MFFENNSDQKCFIRLGNTEKVLRFLVYHNKVVVSKKKMILTPKIGEDYHFDSYFSKGVGSTTN